MSNEKIASRLPSRLTKDVMGFDRKALFWDSLCGDSKDKKVILSSKIQMNILALYKGYNVNQMDGISISKDDKSCYFKPKLKGAVLCENNKGEQAYLTSELLGLIATIRTLHDYAVSHNDNHVKGNLGELLKQVSDAFYEYNCEIRKEFLSASDIDIDIKKTFNLIKNWMK